MCRDYVGFTMEGMWIIVGMFIRSMFILRNLRRIRIKINVLLKGGGDGFPFSLGRLESRIMHFNAPVPC